jgi:ABC-type taurine transport system substrate-binding protein
MTYRKASRVGDIENYTERELEAIEREFASLEVSDMSVYTVQYDQDADPPTLAYLGQANPGSATSASVWRIQKLTFGSGGDVSTAFADGNANFDNRWDDRASLSYS